MVLSGSQMKQFSIDTPPSDSPICPICRVHAKLEHEFCWIISAPPLSLLLAGWESYYVKLHCCDACYPKIGQRRLLQITLLILLPIGVAIPFILKYFVFKDWLTNMSDVRMLLANVAVAWVIWFALFNATGLNRVRVSVDDLIAKGKQVSRKRLKNSTPWFIASYSPRGAERVEFDDATSPPKQ